MLATRYQNLDGPSGQDANRRYVLHLYQGLLGREADALGLANWNNLLYGSASKAQVIAGNDHSVEYGRRQVQQLLPSVLASRRGRRRARFVGAFSATRQHHAGTGGVTRELARIQNGACCQPARR